MTEPSHHRRGIAAASPKLSLTARSPGVADLRDLPDAGFLELWDSILLVGDEKERLLSQAVINFTIRRKVSGAKLPLHGVILLVGPPGTGKTSLARGLAARTAQVFSDERFRYLEVDPHGLSSSSLGKTQRAVAELFDNTIREQALHGPLVVLLDEVETIVADRAKLSLEANPIDVHRATDAALVYLDRLASEAKNVLFVATSNFPRALDGAFVSRADLVLSVPLPSRDARLAILKDTLIGIGDAFPDLMRLAKSASLGAVADATDGLDGRAVRKVVATACTVQQAVALNPNKLAIQDLVAAAKRAVSEASAVAGGTQGRTRQ